MCAGIANGWVLRTHALKAGAKKARLRVRARRYAAPPDIANDAAPLAADAFEEEEELELVGAPPVAPPKVALNDLPSVPANDVFADDDEAPFDPPDESDILGLSEEFEDEVLESDAPFDAPDDIEESCGVAAVAPQRELPTIELVDVVVPAPAPVVAAPRVAAKPEPTRKLDPRVPPIVVQAHWDRAESGVALAALADDKRLARAEISIERGGADGALAALESGVRPDLVIIDSNLGGAALLQSVDRLRGRLGAGAKLIVVGAVNDIGVLRALNARGVGAYLMAPLQAEDLTQTVCGLFAQADRSRVIAVMGARGGVGASTIAHNLAWTIAERLDAPTALIDLDIGFGAAAASFKLDPKAHVTDLFAADVSDETLDAAMTRAHDRLLVAAAPGAPNLGIALESAAVEAMIARVRRTSAFVVLDVPHVWTAWVRDVLIGADEVLLVASPDLASLRNTDNLMKLLRQERGGRAEAAIALTMTGVPKRPEISLKDFSESVGVGPAVTLAFEPDLYGDAEHNGRVLCDAAPKSKAAQAIEVLACGFTGRAVVEQKVKPRRDVVQASVAPPVEAPLELKAEDVAPVVATPVEAAPIVQVMAAPHEDHGLSEFERAFVEKARRKALAALESKRKMKRRVRASRTMVRFLGVGAAAYALGLVTWWSSQQHNVEAQAAPPQVETVALSAPVDPFSAMEADYARAIALLDASNASGLALLTQTAEAGYPLAQYRLAKLYEAGEGVEMSPALALQWTERAAVNGNVRAMHDLGFYHARGDAVALDEAAAFRWFRQAAEFGLADSQYNLGILYQQGRGVTADMSEALFWFTLAADHGDAAAQARIIDLGADLSAIDVEQARARADAFAPRAPNARANGDWTPGD